MNIKRITHNLKEKFYRIVPLQIVPLQSRGQTPTYVHVYNSKLKGSIYRSSTVLLFSRPEK